MPKVTYSDFIESVNELGFLTPNMPNVVPGEQFWTNDPDTDPWLWKTRVAEEKKLIYGSFFNGKKGYIAPRFYSIFIDAFRPHKSMAERYESGKLGQYEWKFWNLLENEGRALGTHEYRSMLGVTAKDGRSALDAAVIRLQLTFDIVTTGNVDMLDKHGKPYNQSVAYNKVENWMPQGWMDINPKMEHEEAIEAIYRQAEKIGADQKSFEKSLKLYKSYS